MFKRGIEGTLIVIGLQFRGVVEAPVSNFNDECEPSVLTDFDTGHVLNTLSLGIIVLDAHFCAIYANIIAQNALAMQLASMRGRPLFDLLPQPRHFTFALRRALEKKTVVHHTLNIGVGLSLDERDSVNVRIVPLSKQMYGAYVLVEIGARTNAHLGTRA